MNKRFLHIAFNWSDTPKISELKPEFDRASDWLRYAPNCWIVFTKHDPETWYQRLKPFLEAGDHIFICAIDIRERKGWLPKSTWEWINKVRD